MAVAEALMVAWGGGALLRTDGSSHLLVFDLQDEPQTSLVDV